MPEAWIIRIYCGWWNRFASFNIGANGKSEVNYCINNFNLNVVNGRYENLKPTAPSNCSQKHWAMGFLIRMCFKILGVFWFKIAVFSIGNKVSEVVEIWRVLGSPYSFLQYTLNNT